MKRIDRAKGFTLLEILVVVAVIAVLAAFLFAAIGHVRENGRSTVCQSNLKQIALGLQQYMQDSGGQYPIAANWQGKILPYVNDPHVFICPTNHPTKDWTPGDTDYGYNFLRLMKIEGTSAAGRHESVLSNPASIYVNYNIVLNDNYRVAPGNCNNSSGVNIGHSGGSNFSFLDGHVKWLNPEQFADLECSLGEPDMRKQ